MRIYSFIEPITLDGFRYSQVITVDSYAVFINTLGLTCCCGSVQIHSLQYLEIYLFDILKTLEVSVIYIHKCDYNKLVNVVHEINTRYKEIVYVSIYTVSRGNNLFDPSDEVILTLDIQDYKKWEKIIDDYRSL